MPLSTLALTSLLTLQSTFSLLPRSPALPLPPAPFLAQASRQTEAIQLLEQGIKQYRSSQFEASLKSLQQALAIFQAINDQPNQIRTIRNIGNVFYLLSEFDRAVAYYQQSLELARKTQNREGEAAALGNLGVIAINQGEYRKANEYYQQALPLYRQVRDRLGEGQTLGNLGDLANSLGNFAQAIAYQQQALAIAREVKDQQLEANTLGSLGISYYNQSNYAKAIEYHQQHLTLARQMGDRRGEAAALNNLGNDYYALGDYGKAIAFLEQRLVIARETQDPLGEAQSYKNLASIYYDLGNYSPSIDYAFKGLEIARKLKNRPLEASVLTQLGNLYLVVQDYDQAIRYHQQRLTLAQSMEDLSGEGISLINLGNVYKVTGQSAKAIQVQQQALAIARKLQDRGLESSALLNLGIGYDDRRQFAQAIEHYQQALTIARSTRDRPTEAQILNNLGNTQFRAGRLAEAETTLRSGLQIWESLRATLGNNDLNKVSIFDQQARTYRLLQRVLVAQNNPEAALEIAERGRARAFVELLARRQETDSRVRTIPNQPIAAPDIQQIRQIARAQNSTLVTYSITYEDVLVNGRIEPRETELFIWAIAPSGTITFRKVDLKPLWNCQGTSPCNLTSLSSLVSSSREGIGVRGRGLGVVASTPALQPDRQRNQLYQLLIQPIADILPQDPNARVTFVPQGSLFLVPFAALQDASGKYLIQRHTILTAPSIQVLDLTRRQQLAQGKREQATTPALIVGNPTMPQIPARFGQPAEQLQPLPGAEQEARAIAPLFGTQAITGDRATKQTIVQLMPQKRLIHLATHGLLDDFKGLGVPGAVALAPAGKDDGLLTADEILNLKLNANLVVLSACDTGRGRITGDGVIGLSRSFISAGVPSVIVSLWAVPDAPTAALMTEFYRQLQRHPDKAQALRQAMLTTLQKYPNPIDWAAFTLIGEAE